MRFGLALPQYPFSLPSGQIGWEDVRFWARRAEDLGFDSVWLSDHLFLDLARYGGNANKQWAMECFTSLAAIAVETQSIHLGSLVVCNDLRPPSVVAKMASTLSMLAGGRIELGMGAGWYEPEFETAGVEFRPAGERVSRLQDSVRIIRSMFEGAPAVLSTGSYQISEAVDLPTHEQHPRIWVGGKGDRVVRIAGRYADGYNAVWAWTPQAYADRLRVLDAAAVKAGRDPSSISRSVGLYTIVGEDEKDVSSMFRSYVKASPEGVADKIDLEAWRTDKLVGTPDAVVETIEAFRALGVEEVILGFGILPFQIADARAVDLFAAEVLPRFRPKSGGSSG